MRVLFITPRFNQKSGGDGLYAYHLARGLISNDVSVSVLTIQDGEFVLMTLHDSNNDFEEVKTLGNVGENQLTQNYYSRIATKAVECAVSNTQPNVIHHSWSSSIFYAYRTALYLKTLGIRTVFTMHDYKTLCGNAGLFSDRSDNVCTKCLDGKIMPPINERCKKNSYIQSMATAAQMAIWKIWRGLNAIDCFHCGSNLYTNCWAIALLLVVRG